MRLKTLRIANFRSVQYLTVDLPQVCAIVGPNNAGKSNILEALRRVLALEWGPRATHFSEDDVYLRDPDRDIEIDCYFEPPLAYRKLKNAADVEIERLRFHPTRQRLIASDAEMPIPKRFEEILKWLAPPAEIQLLNRRAWGNDASASETQGVN